MNLFIPKKFIHFKSSGMWCKTHAATFFIIILLLTERKAKNIRNQERLCRHYHHHFLTKKKAKPVMDFAFYYLFTKLLSF